MLNVGRYSSSYLWFFIYELTSLLVTIIFGLVTIQHGHSHSIESIDFILNHSLLDVVISIWLSNVSSFLLGGILLVINPLLGILSVFYLSMSQGGLLASWLTGYCTTSHFIYGIVETQAYIFLWMLFVKMYLKQKTCNELLCGWTATVNLVKRMVPITIVVFLVLSIVEVVEVLANA